MQAKSITIGLLVFIALLVCGQYLILATSQPESSVGEIETIRLAEIDVEDTLSSLTEISYQVTAGKYDLPFRVTAIPGAAAPQRLNIGLFYDSEKDFEAYRSMKPRSVVVAGMAEILRAELRFRGIEGSVEVCGNTELGQRIALSEVADDVLVFPALVGSVELLPPELDKEALLSWIGRGGTAFVIGGTAFYRNILAQTYPGATVRPSDLASWTPGDANASGLAKVSSYGNEEESNFEWRYDDISSPGKAAWLVCQPVRPSDWSVAGYLQMEMMIANPSPISRVYIDLRDSQGNFAHYYIANGLAHESGWQNVLVDWSTPSYSSEILPDFKDVSKIAFVVDFAEAQPGKKEFALACRGIRLADVFSPIPAPARGSVATVSSEIAHALNITFDSTETGVPVETVEASGGKILGKTSGGTESRTSAASFQLGKGHLVIFGGGVEPPYGQESVSKDIMQILHSGILDAPAVPVSRDYLLSGGETVRDRLEIPAAGADGVNLLFYSTDMNHIFYDSYTLQSKAGL
ncbi:MAG: hypothetical protein PHV74_03670 [Dehalococcoidia bacterium]|nr:hypothetical protein [Dehalococcoidia bacterium]